MPLTRSQQKLLRAIRARDTVVSRTVRLIAETLTVQIPGATYLLLDVEEGSAAEGRAVWPQAVCDSQGAELHRFHYDDEERLVNDPPLPSLAPDFAALRLLWGRSPNAHDYADALHAIANLGALFDLAPGNLAPDSVINSWHDYVVLLTPDARPASSHEIPETGFPLARPRW